MTSSLDKETLEFIASWAERIAVWFAFISAGSALLFVLISRPLKKIEAAERREAQQKFEELKARNLEAEKQLEEVKKRQGPRGLRPDSIVATKAAPHGKVLMEYQEGSNETKLFAQNIWYFLNQAGWNVPPLKGNPNAVRVADSQGDILLAWSAKDSNKPSHFDVLFKAFADAGLGVGSVHPPNTPVPAGVVLIVVCPKT